jgi:hypothetical protein
LSSSPVANDSSARSLNSAAFAATRDAAASVAIDARSTLIASGSRPNAARVCVKNQE